MHGRTSNWQRNATRTIFFIGLIAALMYVFIDDASADIEVWGCQLPREEYLAFGTESTGAETCAYAHVRRFASEKPDPCIDVYGVPIEYCERNYHSEWLHHYFCIRRYFSCEDDTYRSTSLLDQWTFQYLGKACSDASVIDLLTGECNCPAGTLLKRGQCIVPPACENSGSAVGNPCDAATGNKYQAETDYSVSGTGIDLTRSYHSAQRQDFGFGTGWTAGFIKKLLIDGDNLLIQRGAGWQDPFTRGRGAWQGDPDSDFLLVEDEGFTLQLKNGDTEEYDYTGKLVFEKSASGLTTMYQYDVEGRVTGVTGPFGHTMSLTYDDSGHIEAAMVPGNLVYRYTYENKNLARVEYPDGTSRIYHYEDPDHPHALTGITDANGDRFATFAYDSEGRAISTEHAQTDNNSPQESYYLQYDQ